MGSLLRKQRGCKTIRKPTRQSAVWVSIDYKDIDIKGDWTNQNNPTTSIDSNLTSLNHPFICAPRAEDWVKG